MQDYIYRWDERVRLNDFLLEQNGVRRVISWELHRIAKMGGITISDIDITPEKISLKANKNPANMVRRAVEWLQYIRPEYRSDYPLIAA